MNVSEDKVNGIILKYSVLAVVADLTPVVGADVAAVAGCQMKMFYDLASEYDINVTKERITEVLATLSAGIGGWAVTIFCASTMIKAIPGIGSALLFWQPPVIAAFTWAMGQILKSYFPLIKQNQTWDKTEMQEAMRIAFENAKKIDWKSELKSSFRFTK